MNSRQSTVSRVISFVRFPLVMLVVFIHCNFASVSTEFTTHTIATGIANFLSGTIAPVANGAFFFISGMLFFHEGTFSKAIYKRKLRSRLHSLLIPYLTWNALYLLLLFIAETITGRTMAIDKPIADMGVADFLNSFWNISLIGSQSGIAAPVDIPLWFVRDLMVLCLASPIVYLVVKYYSRMHIYLQTCLLLPLFYCIDRLDVMQSMLIIPAIFFTIGAYFSLNHIDICYVFRRMDVAFLMSIIVAFYYNYPNAAYLLMVFLAFSWLGKKIGPRNIALPRIFERSSFFIFAYQTMPVGLIVYLIKSGRITFGSELSALAWYIVSPIAIAVIGIILYQFIDRFLPHLSSILNGDR